MDGVKGVGWATLHAAVLNWAVLLRTSMGASRSSVKKRQRSRNARCFHDRLRFIRPSYRPPERASASSTEGSKAPWHNLRRLPPDTSGARVLLSHLNGYHPVERDLPKTAGVLGTKNVRHKTCRYLGRARPARKFHFLIVPEYG